MTDKKTEEAAQDVKTTIRRIIDIWRQEADFSANYASNYPDDDAVQWRRDFYKTMVADMLPGFGGSTGCDLGCCYGFSTLFLRDLGARRVYGVDPFSPFIDKAQSWQQTFTLEGLCFLLMADTRIPLDDASCDWVVINQVFSNAYDGTRAAALSETRRILKPGGVLVFSDGNNPHCPATLNRLRKAYRDYEIGDGTAAAPRGPAFLNRCRLIRRFDAALGEEEMTALARGTCYAWGAQIKAAVRDYRVTHTLPARFFRDDAVQVPLNPENGRAVGNITDPYELAGQMQALGFETHICMSPDWRPLSAPALAAQLKTASLFYIYARKR